MAEVHCLETSQTSCKSASTQWIFVEQVMRRLRISRSTLYRWVQKGYLKAYRFKDSHILFFDPDEVEQLLRSNAILPSKRIDKTALM